MVRSEEHAQEGDAKSQVCDSRVYAHVCVTVSVCDSLSVYHVCLSLSVGVFRVCVRVGGYVHACICVCEQHYLQNRLTV